MNVAVLIPFRGNRRLLEWTLEGYQAQRLSAGNHLCILVGEDGGERGDGAAAPPSEKTHFPIRRHVFDRMGAAAVRNRLVERVPAGTELIIFGNADARPEPDMVERHIAAMSAGGGLPAGSLVLGSAPWDTRDGPVKQSVFDALLSDSPMVFFYGGLVPRQWYDFRHAWTLNLSVRLADFRASGGFHEELRPVYYEDLAFAHRMMGGEKKQVWYEPAARVLHRHPTTLDQYLDREELLGLMAPVLARVCPQAFEKLHGTLDVAAMASQFRQWLQMDRAMHAWIYRRLGEWAALPSTELGKGEAWQRMLMTIYQMHVPLKRLAFRLGFLRGMEMVEDSRWMERKAVGLWKAYVTG